MKTRFGQIILRISTALAVLIAAALVVCLDCVDYRPYFHQPYYSETIARLRLRAATITISRIDLSACFGRDRLTPTINAPHDDPAHVQFPVIPLAGYDDRKGRPATG